MIEITTSHQRLLTINRKRVNVGIFHDTRFALTWGVYPGECRQDYMALSLANPCRRNEIPASVEGSRPTWVIDVGKGGEANSPDGHNSSGWRRQRGLYAREGQPPDPKTPPKPKPGKEGGSIENSKA